MAVALGEACGRIWGWLEDIKDCRVFNLITASRASHGDVNISLAGENTKIEATGLMGGWGFWRIRHGESNKKAVSGRGCGRGWCRMGRVAAAPISQSFGRLSMDEIGRRFVL